jgi:hypothetical protein
MTPGTGPDVGPGMEPAMDRDRIPGGAGAPREAGAAAVPHRVGFLVFDGVTMLDVSGPSEVLHQVGRLAPPYELVLVSPHGGPVPRRRGWP